MATNCIASGDDVVPDRRNGGCGALIDNKLYFWGGQTADTITLKDSDSDDSDEEEGGGEATSVTVPVNLPRPPDHPFDVLDIPTRTWTRQPTKGFKEEDIPAVGLGSTLTYHPGTHSMYLCAGWNDGNFDSEVYKVSIDNWMWKKLKQATSVKPSPRYLTAVVLHGDRLCMFGGVGPEIVRGQDPGAQYFPYIAHGKTYTFGWNNEYYEFDVNTSEFVCFCLFVCLFACLFACLFVCWLVGIIVDITYIDYTVPMTRFDSKNG